MSPRRPPLATALAGLTAGALAYVSYALANQPLDISPFVPDIATLEAPGTPAAADAGGRSAGVALLPDAAAASAEIAARPLFRPTRRPYDPPAVAAAVADEAPPVAEPAAATPEPPAAVEAPSPPPPLPAGLRLVGIMKSAGTARALLAHEGAGSAQWFEAGADIAGWTLSQIDASAATLSSGGQRETLTLFAPSPPAAGAVASAP